MRKILDTSRVLATWTPRSEWARFSGRWARLEVGSSSRCVYLRVLGAEIVLFVIPRR